MTNTVRRIFELVIPEAKEDRLRAWASEHAYTLVFISVMFVVTWGLVIFDILVGLGVR